MLKIKFVQHGGKAIEINTEEGDSLMQAAVDNEVPGIDADCGGCCSCATCHVYVDKAWIQKVGVVASDEESLLKLVPEREGNSRLSCQITLTKQLDGLIAHLPEYQF